MYGFPIKLTENRDSQSKRNLLYWSEHAALAVVPSRKSKIRPFVMHSGVDRGEALDLGGAEKTMARHAHYIAYSYTYSYA